MTAVRDRVAWRVANFVLRVVATPSSRRNLELCIKAGQAVRTLRSRFEVQERTPRCPA